MNTLKPILLLSTLALVQPTFAQSAFSFARTHGSHVDPMEITEKDDKVIEMLASYAGYGGIPVAVNELAEAYASNPFINILVAAPEPIVDDTQSTFEMLEMRAAFTVGADRINAVGAAGVLGWDATSLAVGLSDFMVERAKDELNAAFFQRFERFFDKYPEAEKLFPKTSQFVRSLLSYQYPIMMQALREAFYEDLNQLPEHIPDALKLEKYEGFMMDFPEINIGLQMVSVLQQLGSGGTAPEVIHGFATIDFQPGAAHADHMASFNAHNMLHLCDLLSQALLNDNGHWATPQELTSLFQDQHQLRLFFGVLYQQLSEKEIGFVNTDGEVTSISEQLSNAKDVLGRWQRTMQSLLRKAEKVELAFEQLQEMKNKGLAIGSRDFKVYVKGVIEMVHFSFDLPSLIQLDIPAMAEVKRITDVLLDMHYDVLNQSYSALVVNAGVLLNEVLRLMDGGGAFAQACKADRSALKELETFAGHMRVYGVFMASIVAAESPDEVSAAIKAAALPVGSASIKKRSQWDISVQSHLGFYYKLDAVASNTERSWDGQTTGITAPVGISFNKGLNSAHRNYGAVGLMVSIIDVGAVVDYQLKQDTITDPTSGTQSVENDRQYTIELGNILSPGAYITYSFPGSIPLALSAGAQYGPGLVSVQSTTTTVLKPVWRYSAALTVDMPLFTLAKRDRKRHVLGVKEK